MENYRFQWDLEGNDILFCNDKSIDDLMDSEEAAIIYTECEILELIDSYLDADEDDMLNDEMISKILDIKDMIKDKIEADVINYAIPTLL